MSRIYKSILPQSQKDSYGENENIDFNLSFEGQSIKRGSLRISGNLGLANIDTTQIDGHTGIHGVFSSVVTEFQTKGVVENLQQYPRLHKMKMLARQDDPQTLSASVNVTSLKIARDEMTTSMLAGAVRLDTLPFCCKLDIMLNRTDSDIPYSKTGAVRISLRTASYAQFMTGATLGAGATTYALTNLELHYQVSESAKSGPVQATTYHLIKHSIDSNNNSISARVPAMVSSVSCSFILASRENSNTYNNLECAELPGVSRVQWTFNDAMNVVKYDITSREEILYNYLKSMGRSDYNSVRTADLVNESRTYGMGLDFYGGINLLNQKLGLDIVSTADNTNVFSMYMFFRSVVQF